MAEVSDELTSERPDIERYLDLVRRRHLQFLIPVLLGWIVVWGASWILPARYKSTTLILVEQPTMPKSYVTPNVSDDLQDRLQSITQQILSRTRLLLIIDKLHLYKQQRAQRTPDDLVAQMRKDIDIELVRNPQEEISSFKVSYSAHDPHVAQAVTSELTNLFINANLETRQQESQNTTDFLQSQLDNARATLSEQDAKVRAFQTEHQGSLPSQQASNLQILGGLQSQLQNEQDALNAARQQQTYYEALIQQNRALPPSLKIGEQTTAISPLAAIDQELARMREKLLDLSSRYTDQYPDVRALRLQIAKTEQMRANLLANLKRQRGDSKLSGKAASGNGGPDGQETGAAFQLHGQLEANRLEISNRERSIAELKERINDYQSRLNEEPAVEQQLADLNRGFDQSKSDFDVLLKKKNESEMATSMEQMQQGQRFTMLDPPSLPQKPDFPNRLKFCGMGLAVGLMFGAIVVGGFEFTDGRLRSEKEIKALLPMAVIAEIPEILSPLDERSMKMKVAIGWAVAAVVVATIAAGSAFSYFRG